MPFRQVIFAPNCYYHVFNRGSEKRTIFQNDRDYQKFLERLKEGLKKFALDLLCFSLLPNHFHFLLKQKTDVSIAKFMNSLLVGHAKFFNTKYQRVGPLFQGRFKAKMIEQDEYLLQLSRYIHRNNLPKSINSGFPSDETRNFRDLLRNYPYSSYQNYLGKKVYPFVETETILGYFSKTNPKLSYQSFVEDTKEDLEALTPWIFDTV